MPVRFLSASLGMVGHRSNESPHTKKANVMLWCFLGKGKTNNLMNDQEQDHPREMVMGLPIKLSKTLTTSLSALLLAVPLAAHAAGPATQAQVAVTPPVFLQLEITSTCSDKGAVFKIINRGGKWPRTGFLRLYHADDKTLIGERRLRLGKGQKVSFVVREKISKGRPVAVWVEPEWYKREFEFDANLSCGTG